MDILRIAAGLAFLAHAAPAFWAITLVVIALRAMNRL
jgi:hypothetical protein